MLKYIIAICDPSYNPVMTLGDDDGNPFDTETEAYNFIVEKGKKGEINYSQEDRYFAHGSCCDEFITCQNGTRYRVFYEEIKEFRKELFENKKT